jgi:hypothetical protein
MKPSRLAALFSFCLLVFGSVNAEAQMSEGEKKAAARAAYQAGVGLQDQGKPAEALVKFEGAQKLYDAPTHLLHIAECQALLGKLVEASETYQSMIVKPLPAGSPEVFQQAVEQAKAEAPALRARIPTLKVTVKPPPGSLQGLQIYVNDKTMPNELVDIARPVNPGPYRVSAQAANGYGTRGPVDFELKEKETKNLDLELVQGGGGAVVTPVPPPYSGNNPPGGGTTDPNAGADKPKPPPKDDGPPSTGLMFGGHGGLFVPAGDVAKVSAGGASATTEFDQVASTGGGIGIDFLARFAKVFLVGARAEGIFLGGPDAKKVPQGTTLSSSTNMIGAAVVIGLMTSQDKVGFVADLGFGYRVLNTSGTATTGASSQSFDRSFNGTYFALGAGISIPAGPIRIVPKVGVDFGSLQPADTAFTTPGGTISTAQFESAGYQMFFVGVAVFYNFDLGKKPTTAGRAPSTVATF